MRIHIWTASYGHGYHKAALLLGKAAQAQQHEVIICKPLEQGHTVMHKLNKKLCSGLLSFAPGIWRKYSKQIPPVFIKKLYHVLQKPVQDGIGADLVLSVHPLLTSLAAEGKKRSASPVPLYHVATDYWQAPFLNLSVHGFFLPDLNEKKGTSTGPPIFPTGIPTQKITKRYTKKECCLENGWNPSKPLILVDGRGEGIFSYRKVVKELKKIPTASTIVVVSGTRPWKKSKHVYGKDIHVLPLTDRFSDFLQAADVMVTKAGGMTLAEAATHETPMILFAPLAGRQEQNASYFAKQNAAFWAFTSKSMREKVKEYIRCPLERERAKRRLRRIKQPESAEQIITIAVHHASRTMLYSKINSK
ncbi:glycosyltransferase [Salibacterium salarium]|nr:glycosyltransferase [Salibacterium salarium]